MKVQLYDRGFDSDDMFRYIVKVKCKPYFWNSWKIICETDSKRAAIDVYTNINTPQVIFEKIV